MNNTLSVKENKIDFRSFILPSLVVIVTSIFCYKFMGQKDFSAVLTWWVLLLIIGLIFQPLALILFNRFHDNGWMFSKTLGIAISAWLVWYLSSIKLLKFTRLNCIIVMVLCIGINIGIFWLYNRYSRDRVDIASCYAPKKILSMINAEAIFFVVLFLWCYIKGYNSAAYSTEKFMDYGFITSILKSDYMPAHDMWLSGNSINYYYVGQYISAFLVRVSGVGAGYGYNLMMMTLAAFGFSLPYSIGYNLMKRNHLEKPGNKNVLAGSLSAVCVSLAGNMHFPIFKWIMPKIQRILGENASNYWFADSTRYIGYNPDRADKTIHEYPSYSFVLGDLHAHVINIIFVLTVVGILLAWLIRRRAYAELTRQHGVPDKLDYVREIFNPHMLACMFFIGLFHMTNYWDFPIYFCVCGSIVLYSNLVTYRYSKHAWIMTALQGVTYVLVWTIVSLPFTLAFDSISSSIKLCSKHTLWYQFLVLWGLPLAICLVFIITRHMRAHRLNVKYSIENKVRKKRFIPSLLDSLTDGDAFVMILAYCAIGLIIIPEVIYVVDIYGGAYQRANTMFKLVYQAYILFAICMPYIIIKFLKFKVPAKVRTFTKVALVLLCCTFCYFFEALDAWFTGFYKGLDASGFLKNEDAADKMAIEWINKNVDNDDVVLEMCGLSYTFFNRISVFTGNQTVLGWQTHEWLWRSSGNKDYPSLVTERHQDVVKIYTTTSAKELVELIRKYNIDYIYVGQGEHFDGYVGSKEGSQNAGYYHGSYYTKLIVNDALLKSLGEVKDFVTEGGASSYIVKVDYDKLYELQDKEVTYNDEIIRPSSIITTYADGSKEYTNYSYNTDGNVTYEEYIDTKGEKVSYVKYGYSGIQPSIGEVYDSKNVLQGFYNYIEFDAYGRCVLQHYFAPDNTWRNTTTRMYSESRLMKEDIKSSDGINTTIEYTYDAHNIMTSKTYSGSKNEKYEYVNDGKNITTGIKYVDGKQVATLEYTY